MIADDHQLVRTGIRILLEQMSGVEVVAEADDGREALKLIASIQPDIVLMDIAMPKLNGLEATARITKEFPSVRVIILSMSANKEYVLQSLRAGAAGYLLKGVRAAELERAVASVSRGETYLSPAASIHVSVDDVQRASNAAVPSQDERNPVERLTPRQREILQLIAEGRSTREIAHALNISVKTAETHRTQIMERLGIRDIAGLLRYAIRIGLIAPSE
jgi:DNA-binding NarL/FixJ family response regulator